jgi:enoyl-CoA hydratase
VSVRVERTGPVFTILMGRPETKNAIDRDTAHALTRAFDEFEADDEAFVAVLYGEGGTFCSGADLKAVAGGTRNDVDPDGPGPLGPTRRFIDKPVIAAVEGHAVAGGLELALLADLRVVAEDAVFGVFCRRWGVPLIDVGTVRLARVVGHGRALDMILTGRPVGAAEAFAIGLATGVVPRGETRAAAEALALEIASFPQACVRADRRSALRQWDLPFAEALRAEARGGLPVIHAEALAGAAAFSAGRGRHGRFDD